MRYVLLLAFLATSISAQINISPSLITQCTNGHGHATLTWIAPAGSRVQIRIGARDGVPMTALTDATGSAQTGDWIDDGMTFYLVNDAGVEFGRVTAHQNCGGIDDTIASALTASTAYLPLQVGNQWIYRMNSRFATSIYTSWTLTRTQQIGDQTWYVLEMHSGASDAAVETLIRYDEQGRLHRLPNYPRDLTDEVWLDPTGGPATLEIQNRDVAVNTPAGTLPVGLNYRSFGGLLIQSGTFARGLGLLTSTTSVFGGSSGGFSDGLTLVESRVGQGIFFTQPATGVELAAERSKLEVTAKRVTNCAIPCYFAACGIAGSADPPDT